MKKLWIAFPLLMAFVLGCGTSSSDPADASADAGSANVSDEQASATGLPSDPATQAERDTPNETEFTAALADESTDDESTDDESTDNESTDDEIDQTTTERAAEQVDEATAQQIKQEISSRLNDAMQERDFPAAIVILDEARKKLPNDQDIGMALVSIRIQNDLQLAGAGDKEAAAKSMTETAATIQEILGEDGALPQGLAAYWNVNEARRHAFAGKVDEAAAALDQAFENGFNQLASIREDEFFREIKENEMFQRVLAGAQEKVRARFRQMAQEEFAQAESFEFDFALNDLEDKPVKLADFEGKVVIVDIWGTWCPPCRMEIPHFIDLQNEYKDDLAIVGITYERTQDIAQAKQQIADFIKTEGVNYPCVIGDEATQQAVQVEGFPTTLFIDHTGKVRLKVVGYHPYEKLEGYVAELVAERKAAKPSS